MKELTIEILKQEAKKFAQMESNHEEASIYGSTDGKAVGTYLEHKFQSYLEEKYTYQRGSSASGIDFPAFDVDMKVTSITQPQSSCPFKSARQKVYGLGYSLLVFVYKKEDNENFVFEFTRTIDILENIGRNKSGFKLIGFALETDNGPENAKKKLKSKNLDMIVLNDPNVKGAGFGTDTNVVTLIDKKGSEELPLMSKYDVGNAILNKYLKDLKTK